MLKTQYTIGVNADTSKAQAAINKLNQSLRNVQSQKYHIQIQDESINKAAEAALILQNSLIQATNVNTGKLDLTKLNASLTAAKTSVSELGASLLSAGTEGQQAFMALTNTIANAQMPVKQLNTIFTNLGTTLLNTIKWQAASSLVHGLMSTISGAISYAKNLNSSLTDIRVVTGASSDEMAKFATYANQAAKSLSTTTNDFVKATLIYRQQGDTAELAAKKAEITTKAANVAFTASAKEMSEMLTAVWNSYQMGANELEHTVDVMAKLGATTASSMEEMATGMQKVAATANTVGVSMEQMSAMIATSASVTRQAPEQIGTAWNTILSRIGGLKLGETLEDGVDLNKYSSALQTIGVNILDANGELRQMGTVVYEIGEKWNTLTTAQKSALAQTIGGVRQYTQIMAFFENFDKYQENMKTAQYDSAGALQEQQDIWAESWEAASKRARAALEDLYSQLVDDKAMIKLTNFFTTLINGVTHITSSFGGATNVIGMLATTIISANIDTFSMKLTEIGNSLKTLFSGNAEITAYAQTLSNMREQLKGFLEQEDISLSDKITLEYDIEILNIKQRIAEQQGHITKAQQESAEQSIRQLEASKEMYVSLLQQNEQQEKQAQQLKTNIVDKAAFNYHKQTMQFTAPDSMSAIEKERDFTKYWTLLDAKQQKANLIDADAGAMQSVFDALSVESAQSLEEAIKSFVPELQEAGVTAKDITFSNAIDGLTTATQKASELAAAGSEIQKNFEVNKEWSLQNYTGSPEDLQKYISKISAQAQNSGNSGLQAEGAKLQAFFANGIPVGDQASQAAESLKNIATQFNNSAESILSKRDEIQKALVESKLLTEDEAKSLIAAFERVGASTNKLADDAEVNLKRMAAQVQQNMRQASNSVQTFVKFTMSLQSIVNTFNTISNALETLRDPDASGWEKLSVAIGALVSIGMTATTVMRLLSSTTITAAIASGKAAAASVVTAAAKTGEAVAWHAAAAGVKAFFAALGPIGWIILAITALVTIVTAVAAAIGKYESAEEKANKAREKALADYNALEQQQNSEIARLNSLKEILDNTTMSMNEQLSKINEITSAFGLQVTAIDLLSDSYSGLNKNIQRAMGVDQSQIAQKAQEAADSFVKNMTFDYNTQIDLGTLSANQNYDQYSAWSPGSLILDDYGYNTINGDTLPVEVTRALMETGYFIYSEFVDAFVIDVEKLGTTTTDQMILDVQTIFKNSGLSDDKYVNAFISNIQQAQDFFTDEAKFLLANSETLLDMGAFIDTDINGNLSLVMDESGDREAVIKFIRESEIANSELAMTLLDGLNADQIDQANWLQEKAKGQLKLANLLNNSDTVIDFAGIGAGTGVANIQEFYTMLKDVAEFNPDEDSLVVLETLVNYFEQLPSYNENAAGINAVIQQSQQIGTMIPGLNLNTVQITDELLNYLTENADSITWETLVKIRPTAFEFNSDGKLIEIDDSALQVANLTVKVDNLKIKAEKIDELRNLKNSSLTAEDYITVQESGVFNDHPELLSTFLLGDKDTRSSILDSLEVDNNTALQQANDDLIVAKRAELIQLQEDRKKYFESSDYANFRTRTYTPFGAPGAITTDDILKMTQDYYAAEGRVSLYEAVEAMGADNYAALTKDQQLQALKVYNAVNNANLTLAEFDAEKYNTLFNDDGFQNQLQSAQNVVTVLSGIVSSYADLDAQISDTETSIANLEEENAGLDFEKTVTIPIRNATTAIEAFSNAITNYSTLTEKDFVQLALATGKSIEEIVSQYQTLSEADWASAMFNNAMNQYDKQLRIAREQGDVALEQEILSKRWQTQIEYGEYLGNIDTSKLETARAEWDKIAAAAQAASEAIAEFNSKDLTFASLAEFKQTLLDSGMELEKINALIQNLTDPSIDDKDKLAAQAIAAGNAALDSLTAHYQEYQAISGISVNDTVINILGYTIDGTPYSDPIKSTYNTSISLNKDSASTLTSDDQAFIEKISEAEDSSDSYTLFANLNGESWDGDLSDDIDHFNTLSADEQAHLFEAKAELNGAGFSPTYKQLVSFCELPKEVQDNFWEGKAKLIDDPEHPVAGTTFEDLITFSQLDKGQQDNFWQGKTALVDDPQNPLTGVTFSNLLAFSQLSKDEANNFLQAKAALNTKEWDSLTYDDVNDFAELSSPEKEYTLEAKALLDDAGFNAKYQDVRTFMSYLPEEQNKTLEVIAKLDDANFDVDALDLDTLKYFSEHPDVTIDFAIEAGTNNIANLQNLIKDYLLNTKDLDEASEEFNREYQKILTYAFSNMNPDELNSLNEHNFLTWIGASQDFTIDIKYKYVLDGGVELIDQVQTLQTQLDERPHIIVPVDVELSDDLKALFGLSNDSNAFSSNAEISKWIMQLPQILNAELSNSNDAYYAGSVLSHGKFGVGGTTPEEVVDGLKEVNKYLSSGEWSDGIINDSVITDDATSLAVAFLQTFIGNMRTYSEDSQLTGEMGTILSEIFASADIDIKNVNNLDTEQWLIEVRKQFEESGLYDVGKFILLGIAQGITANGQTLSEALTSLGLGDSVLSTLFTIFDIHSPSHLTEYVGQMIIAGISKGMADGVEAFDLSVLNALETKVLTHLQNMGQRIQNSEIFKSAIDRIQEQFSDGIVWSNGTWTLNRRSVEGKIALRSGPDTWADYSSQINQDIKQATQLTTGELIRGYFNPNNQDWGFNTDENLTAIERGILSLAWEDILQNNKDLIEGIDDVDGQKLLEQIEKYIDTDSNEIIKKIQADWANLEDQWRSVLSGVVRYNQQEAEAILTTWTNTFQGIAEAREAILNHQSIGQALFGDPDELNGIIHQWLQAGKNISEIQNLISSNDKSVLTELQLSSLDTSVGAEMNVWANAQDWTKYLNWQTATNDQGEITGRYLADATYDEYARRHAADIQSQVFTDPTIANTVYENITHEIENFINGNDEQKQAAAAVLQAFSADGLIGELDTNWRSWNQDSLVKALGENDEGFAQRLNNSGIWTDIATLVANGLIISAKEFNSQDGYSSVIGQEIIARQEHATTVQNLAETKIKNAQTQLTAIQTARQQLLDGGSLDDLDSATQKLIREIFNLDDNISLNILRFSEIETANMDLLTSLEELGVSAKQASWLLENGYDLTFNEDGQISGGSKMTSTILDDYDMSRVNLDTMTYTDDSGKVWSILSDLSYVLTKSQFNPEEWQQREDGNYYNQHGDMMTEQDYTNLSSNQTDVTSSTATITAGALTLGTLEQFTTDELTNIAEANMPENYITGNATVDGIEDIVTDDNIKTIESYASAVDMTTTEFENYAKILQQTGKLTDEAIDETGKLKSTYAPFVTNLAKMERGFKTARDKGSDLLKELKKMKTGSGDWIKAATPLREMYGDILGLGDAMNDLSPEFLESAENMKLAQKAAEGNEEALNSLQKAFLQDFTLTNGGTWNDQLDELAAEVASYDFKDIEIGATIDDADFLAKCMQLVNQAGLTADEASAALSAMGVDAEIEEHTVNLGEDGKYTVKQAGQVMIPKINPDGSYSYEYLDVGGGYDLTGEPNSEVTYYTLKGAKYNGKGVTHGGAGSKPSGKGGGGGGGGSKKQTHDKIKPDKRYQTVDRQLDDQSKLLEKISKEKEKAYGPRYLKYLNEEIKALEKENELYEEKLRQNEQWLSHDLNDLETQTKRLANTLGVNMQLTFDENGEVSNLQEMWEAFQKKYNEFADKEMSDDDFKKYEDAWKEWEESFGQYQETLDTRDDIVQEMQDNLDQISENILEGIKVKAEYRIELNDADIKLLEYYQEKYEDILDKQGELTHSLLMQTGEYLDNAAITAQAIQELNEAFAAGNINEAQYQEEIAAQNENLLDTLKELNEMQDKINEAYENAISLAEESFENQTDNLDHINTLLADYQSIVGLLGKGVDYGYNDKIYQAQIDNNLRMIEANKAMYDEMQKRVDEFEAKREAQGGVLDEADQEHYEAALERAHEYQEEILSEAQDTAQKIQDAYTNMIDNISNKLQESLLGDGESFQHLSDQYATYTEDMGDYLTAAKELSEISKLNREIDKSIEDSTTRASKERLLALQNEISAKAASNKLTDYDVQMLNLQYQLALKMAALEDAEDAKSVVRLTRDNNGNYAYQYTADEDKVASAQQEYEDVLQQINELAGNRITELEQSFIDAQTEYLDAATQIAQDTALTDEQRAERLEELWRNFQNDMLYLEEQYNNATGQMMQNQDAISAHYGQTLEDRAGQTIAGINDRVQSLIDNVDGFKDAWQEMLTGTGEDDNSILNAAADMGDAIKSLADYAKLTLSDEDIENFKEQAAAAVGAAVDLVGQLGDELDEVDAVTDAWNSQADALDRTINYYELLASSANKALHAVSELDDIATIPSLKDWTFVSTDNGLWPAGGISATDSSLALNQWQTLKTLEEINSDTTLTDAEKQTRLEELEQSYLETQTQLEQNVMIQELNSSFALYADAILGQMQMNAAIIAGGFMGISEILKNKDLSCDAINERAGEFSSLVINADFPNAHDANDIMNAFTQIEAMASQTKNSRLASFTTKNGFGGGAK